MFSMDTVIGPPGEGSAFLSSFFSGFQIASRAPRQLSLQTNSALPASDDPSRVLAAERSGLQDEPQVPTAPPRARGNVLAKEQDETAARREDETCGPVQGVFCFINPPHAPFPSPAP